MVNRLLYLHTLIVKRILILKRILVLPEKNLVNVHLHFVLLEKYNLRWSCILIHDASKDESIDSIKTEAVEVGKSPLWSNQLVKIHALDQLDHLALVTELD